MASRRPIKGAGAARLVTLWSVAIASAAGGAYLLLPLAARTFVRVIVFLSDACVQLALLLSAGGDMWTIVRTMGRLASNALSSGRAVALVSGLILVGAAALYGLQRLLGSDEESLP